MNLLPISSIMTTGWSELQSMRISIRLMLPQKIERQLRMWCKCTMKQCKRFHSNEHMFMFHLMLSEDFFPHNPIRDASDTHPDTHWTYREGQKCCRLCLLLLIPCRSFKIPWGTWMILCKENLIVKACTHPHSPSIWPHTVLNFIHRQKRLLGRIHLIYFTKVLYGGMSGDLKVPISWWWFPPD